MGLISLMASLSNWKCNQPRRGGTIIAKRAIPTPPRFSDCRWQSLKPKIRVNPCHSWAKKSMPPDPDDYRDFRRRHAHIFRRVTSRSEPATRPESFRGQQPATHFRRLNPSIAEASPGEYNSTLLKRTFASLVLPSWRLVQAIMRRPS